MNRRRPAAVFILIVGAAVSVRSQSVISFTFSPGFQTSASIIESLANGHRAEIRYEARVYRRTAGISRIFGDELVAEQSVTYDARWDELNRRYVVVIYSGRERSFEDSESLLRFLLVLEEYRMMVPKYGNGEIYLMCRAQIEPVRLVPPLTLMNFLVPRFRTKTPWRRTDFRRHER